MKNLVINGDCLEKIRDIPDKTIDMILTDLPYGVTARNKWDIIIPIKPLFTELKRVCKGAIVMTATNPFASKIIFENLDIFKYDLVWKKGEKGSGHLNGNKMPLRNHELILVFYDSLPTYNPQKTIGTPYRHARGLGMKSNSDNYGVFSKKSIDHHFRLPKSVIDFKTVVGTFKQKMYHPTQKPVELFEYLIKTYTNEGELVLDCCAGSGTTAIACIKTNRNYICIEKELEYFNIIQKRIEGNNNHKLETFPMTLGDSKQ